MAQGVPGLTSDTRVILWVKDFDASVRFYQDVLGLAPAYPPGGGWAEFTTGGPALCLHEGRQSETSTRGVAVFGWRVEDLDAAVAHVRAQGVDATDPKPVTEGVRSSEFHDPSGNSLFFEGA